ncbi:condensation domain-containing protein, partial [Chryseobacterium potabilaquae]|uniref:condensation domain-containing protein n=1 Tax=Chryseobacterium potabilaquae TaxID=2675057 RepID=UPI00138972DE
SSFHILDPKREYQNIPIGRPVPNSISVIVDAHGNLIPKGMVGELCLIGDQISRGYWQRSELTAEKFISSPFVKGEKMYRTGDLARWNEKGELECLGRIDSQVKLRGFRIELGEIESVMIGYEGVQSAVVEIKEIGGIQHLCGYYTANQTIKEEVLRGYLSASLTDYMVPTIFIQLEVLPLTPNGKINRKMLPDPEMKRQEIVFPETSLEKSLLSIVSNLLNTKEFGVTTNLISMGLTSMGAIKLSLAVKKELGLILTVKDILSNLTIRKWVDTIKIDEQECKLYEKKEYYPLTENQVGVYIQWLQNRDSLQYNIALALKLTDVNGEKLQSAVSKALKSHSYLKVHFEIKNGNVVQVRRDDAPLHITFESLDMEPDAGFFQNFVRPFNLLEEDLYRIAIYTTAQHTYLFIDIHHIIYDGGSVDILLKDIVHAYKGLELKEEVFTAYEYSLEYNEWTKSNSYIEAEKYFDDLVGGTESLLYPLSSITEAISKSKKLSISVDRSEVKKTCKNLKIT